MNSIRDTKPEKDWPEDFSHENGMYYCRCVSCKELFIGYKRRVVCRECSEEMPKTRTSNTSNPIDFPKETERYDVVIDTLQKHYDKLWDMSKNKEEWGVMDYIRLEQMQQLKDAMKLWNTRYRPGQMNETEDCGCQQNQICNNVACPRAMKVTC